MTPPRDHVVVVTGASSGIGRAAAVAFARRGATVVLAARREAHLKAVAEQCRKAGGRALVVPTDVTDETAVRNLAARAIESFGRIDVWLNNAAVSAFGRFEETPPEVFRRVIETNFFGYVYGARAALRRFREQGYGTLINNSSIVAEVAQPYTSAYVAAKHAVRALGMSLRQELLDTRDIHVCTVMPTSTDTPIFEHAANFSGRAIRPVPPVYSAEQVAKAIVGLASRPKRELLVGNAGRVLSMIQTLAPGQAERMMARTTDRKHFKPYSSMPPSTGNLFEPAPDALGVSGGWIEPPKPLWRRAVVAGIGIAGLYWWRSRKPARESRVYAAFRRVRKVA